MSDDEKLELFIMILEHNLNSLDKIKLPMNDIEARMMKGKKGNFLVRLIIYNPAVDYDTKMICALHVTQSPTDHYLLPEVADKAINNIGKVPTYMSADTIYLNQISLSYFVKQWNRMD